MATAGRRAGAEAKPNATTGRCCGETGPRTLLPNEVLRNARGGCQAPLKSSRDASGREATGGRQAPRHGPRTLHVVGAPLLVLPGARDSGAQMSTWNRASARPDVGDTRDGCRASAGRAPSRGRSILFQRCPAPAPAIRKTDWGATAGVQSLRTCRIRFEAAWAHSRGGHPREARIGEERHSRQAGRRDARRRPMPPENAACTLVAAGRRAGAEAR
jgi:hypothetical protein